MDNLNKALDKAVEALEDVIRGITRKDNITPAELEHLSKSICTIERIKNIQREENNSDEYSANSYRHSRFSSREGNSRRYYDSNSYSGHSIRDRMIAKLEEMYDEAQTNHERQVMQDWIDRLSTR